MKVMFLDHDGVICLQKQWGKRLTKKAKDRGDKFDPFDSEAIKVLNRIIKETGCVIVSSTTWREMAPLKEMQDLFIERGVATFPIDYTDELDIEPTDYIDWKEANNSNWYKSTYGTHDQKRLMYISALGHNCLEAFSYAMAMMAGSAPSYKQAGRHSATVVAGANRP